MTTLKKEEQKVYTGIAAMERATVHPIIRNKKDAVMFYTIEEDGTVMDTSLNGGKKAKRSRDMAFFMRNEFVDYIEPLKEGDYVKVLGNEHTRPAAGSHRFEEGTIVKLLNPTTGYEGFRAEFLDRHDWWNVHIKDLAPVTAEEVEAFKLAEKRKKLKVGDIVKVISSEASANADGCGRHGIEVGTIVKVLENGSHGFTEGDVLRIYDIVNYGHNRIRKDYFYNRELALATGEEEAAAEKTAQKTELKEGGYARVIANTCNHGFPIGEIIKLTCTHAAGFKAHYLDGHDFWFMKLADLEPVTTEEAVQKPLTKGDYAKVTRRAFNTIVQVGDIVKIIKDDNSMIPFEIETLEGKDVGWIPAADVEPVAKEEVKKAKRKAEEEKARKVEREKYEEVGRKVGELKAGDIVRITSLYGATKVSVGDLVEVRSARGDGDFHDTKHGYILKGELVVPVEKRFDKKA